MKWIDIQDIVYCLIDKYPDQDPKTLLFTDLMNMVSTLEEFDDSPEKCGERILEAIQALWIEEAD
ncbi:MAG: Fe-S assembly protein IscX [Flavobacteriaceae bacterium]|jgi:FeS assembly protein IscX|nr:Fe-S assembly protein IscX [Flavobacteriaceae bacterium]|tara:strand:+ start:13903 stop:14097 length:195 start_codon:yes stop_codon:yes gene_type:complete